MADFVDIHTPSNKEFDPLRYVRGRHLLFIQLKDYLFVRYSGAYIKFVPFYRQHYLVLFLILLNPFGHWQRRPVDQ